MSKITIRLKSVKCYNDTSELDSDEPYVIVFAASLNRNAGISIPAARSIIYGPWGQVDSGDAMRTDQAFFGSGAVLPITPPNFWGLNGAPSDLNDDNDAIFLVALMENDNGTPEAVRGIVHAQLFASLISYLSSGMSRDALIRQLLKDMHGALKGPATFGVANFDDLVGVAELRVGVQDQHGSSQTTSLHINGDGGRYELFFETVSQTSTTQSALIAGHAVYGEIRKKYDSLGGESGFLGKPLNDETGTPDGVGRYNHFEHGSIYWSPSTGAREIHGNIRARWAQFGWEQSFLGYPTTDETPAPDGYGRYNHFEHGSIYWTQKTDAWEVHGSIRDQWAAMGWERSQLGYPITNEHDLSGGGRVSVFQRGRICWRQDRGAWVERALILRTPAQLASALAKGSAVNSRSVTSSRSLSSNS